MLIPIFYLVSVLALVFHFANGLWTAAITWGLTVSTGAQRRWGWVCAAVGVGLSVMGVVSVVGFATLDVEQARAIERLIHPDAEAAEVVQAEEDPRPPGLDGRGRQAP